MPEKFIVGTIDIIAVAKIAAICDLTKLETNKPKLVEAWIASIAPKNIAQTEPLIGTSNTMIATQTISK